MGRPESSRSLGSRARITMTISRAFREISSSREATILGAFVMINALYMVIQIYYGLNLGVMGLLTRGVHTAFTCITMSLALVAITYSSDPPTFQYSYGHERQEVLSAFTNCCFLLFLAVFLAAEGLHDFGGPPENSPEIHIQVISLGTFLSLAQLMVLRATIKRKGGWPLYYKILLCAWNASESMDVYFSARESNLQVIFCHLVADFVASFMVTLATSIFSQKSIRYMDPLSSITLASLLFINLIPIVRSTGAILLQGKPLPSQGAFDRAIKRVLALPEVAELQAHHFWTLTPGYFVGTLHLLLRPGVTNDDHVLIQVHEILLPSISDLTVQLNRNEEADSDGGMVEILDESGYKKEDLV